MTKINWWLVVSGALMLALGVSIGHYAWREVPPERIVHEYSVTVAPIDSSSIIAPVTHHFKDSLSRILRSQDNAWKGMIYAQDGALAAIYDSLSRLMVGVYTVDTMVTVKTLAVLHDSSDIDIMREVPVKVGSSVVFVGEPVNRFTELRLSLAPIHFQIPVRERVREIPAPGPGPFWATLHAGLWRSPALGGSIGCGPIGVGAIALVDDRPLWLLSLQHRF